MITFHICNYSRSFEVTEHHQGFQGSNSIANHAVVLGVRVITVAVQVILTAVLFRAFLSSLLALSHTELPQRKDDKKFKPNYFQLCIFKVWFAEYLEQIYLCALTTVSASFKVAFFTHASPVHIKTIY